MGEMGDEPIRDLMARAPRRKFTVSDYHRMGDAGILGADDRVELIEGELFEMAPSPIWRCLLRARTAIAPRCRARVKSCW